MALVIVTTTDGAHELLREEVHSENLEDPQHFRVLAERWLLAIEDAEDGYLGSRWAPRVTAVLPYHEVDRA